MGFLSRAANRMKKAKCQYKVDVTFAVSLGVSAPQEKFDFRNDSIDLRTHCSPNYLSDLAFIRWTDDQYAILSSSQFSVSLVTP